MGGLPITETSRHAVRAQKRCGDSGTAQGIWRNRRDKLLRKGRPWNLLPGSERPSKNALFCTEPSTPDFPLFQSQAQPPLLRRILSLWLLPAWIIPPEERPELRTPGRKPGKDNHSCLLEQSPVPQKRPLSVRSTNRPKTSMGNPGALLR